MKKELANKILKETDNYYYFFDKSGIFRRLGKDSQQGKLLIRCNINTLIEEKFNKKIEDNRLSNLLSRLKPGDSIETLERYLKPERHLGYRVLMETDDEEHLYYYFDHNGVYIVSPYIIPLTFPIHPYSFVEYILGLKIEKEDFQKAIRKMKPGETIQDLENHIVNAKNEKIFLPRNKKFWKKSLQNNILKKLFRARNKNPRTEET